MWSFFVTFRTKMDISGFPPVYTLLSAAPLRLGDSPAASAATSEKEMNPVAAAPGALAFFNFLLPLILVGSSRFEDWY